MRFPLLTLPPMLPPTRAVAAGIPQRMLLDYLSEYRHCKQAAGWTLPAFTWWTDQVGPAGCRGRGWPCLLASNAMRFATQSKVPAA